MQLTNGPLRLVAVGVILATLTAACDTPESEGEATTTLGPHDNAAEVIPDLIILDPPRATAGSLVSVLFPDERTRGVLYVLESRTGDRWNLEYYLLSDWSGTRSPASHEADSMGIAIEDIGFSGPGPDIISIPAEATPGDYRICTGNSRPNICALLTIDADA